MNGAEAVATGAPTIAPSNGGLVRAVAIPLGVVGLAVVMWLVSDRLLYVGPLDRATFGWAIVVPTFSIAPFVAALAWSRLQRPTRIAAAAIVWAVVGLGAAVAVWTAVAFPSCTTGLVHQPAEWLLPSFLLGTAFGAGPSLGGLVAAVDVQRGHRWRALAEGAAVQFAAWAVVLGILAMLAFSGTCQRP